MATPKGLSNIENIDMAALENLVGQKEGLNYKQLCKELNIPELAGNSKVKQLRELSSIMKYEKKGVKYYITEICDDLSLSLFNNRSIYLPYIQLILTDMFEKSGQDYMYTTTKEMMHRLGMVNDNYMAVIKGDLFNNCRVVSQAHDMSYGSFFTYMDTTYNSVLKPIIKSALNSMKNSRSIDIATAYCMHKVVKVNGTNVYTTDYVNIMEEKGRELFKLEGEVMTELGVRDTSELFGRKSYLISSYYDMCNAKLAEKSEGKYDGFYRCYYITINQKRLAHNVSELRDELNTIIKNRIKTADIKDLKKLTGEEMTEFVRDTILIGQTDKNFREDIMGENLNR